VSPEHYDELRDEAKRKVRLRWLSTPKGKKRCIHCEKTKPVERFRLDSNYKDNRQNVCKDCQNERKARNYGKPQ
jgi:hypothetical protein